MGLRNGNIKSVKRVNPQLQLKNQYKQATTIINARGSIKSPKITKKDHTLTANYRGSSCECFTRWFSHIQQREIKRGTKRNKIASSSI
jgi:hypothetical protein